MFTQDMMTKDQAPATTNWPISVSRNVITIEATYFSICEHGITIETVTVTLGENMVAVETVRISLYTFFRPVLDLYLASLRSIEHVVVGYDVTVMHVETFTAFMFV